MIPNPSRRGALAAMASAWLAGCGYSIRPPYNKDISTVYVPPFRSRTFRRDVNLMLTEEVIKEIERRTPYKVVGHEEGADTTLQGEINFTDKNLILPNPFNLPRQLTATLTANMTWTDNRSEKPIGDPAQVQNGQPGGMVVTTVYNFFPEIGETSEAAFYRTAEKLAIQIVNMMEKAW
jgi:hypothetical protein